VLAVAAGVGVAVRVPDDGKNRDVVAGLVRELMQEDGRGAAVRAMVADMQKAAADGLREGGAAAAGLAEVVAQWTATGGQS
jgi:hydroquinone glucosyltransferase